MKKKALFCLIMTALMLLSAACDVIKEPPLPTDMTGPTKKSPRETKGPISVGDATGMPPTPTTTPRATSTETPIVIPTNTPEPTPDPNLQLESTKMQEDVWFTYPSGLWYSTSDPVFPNLQSKKFAECQIYLNNGHGMPDYLTATTQDEYLEGVKFSVTVLKPIGSEDIVFKSYLMGDFFQFTIENPGFEVLNEQCLQEGEEVLRYSIKQGFKPVEHHEPKAQTLPPVVYAKDFNIWAYYVDTDVKQQLTFDGSNDNKVDSFRYVEPKVSPDGRFVAYEEISTIDVYVYSLETGETWKMLQGTLREDIFDNVMGWDKNNHLYISRQYGSCGMMEDTVLEPEAIEILTYDPAEESLRHTGYLPMSQTDSGNAPRGFDVSSSGRYVSFWKFTCNPSWPVKAAIYDLENETTIEHDWSLGAISLSHDETMMASPNDLLFNQSKNIYVNIADFQGSGAFNLDHLEGERTVWSNPHWSFDDNYLVLRQNAITNPEIMEYNPMVWWSLGNTGWVMVNTFGERTAKYVTDRNPADADWEFASWSPLDYRMVLIQRAPSDNPMAQDSDTLWLIEPFTNTAYIIDQGEFIQGADW